MGNSQHVERKLLKAATIGSATYSRRVLPGFVGGGVDQAPTAFFDHDQQGFHHYISWATGTTAGTVVIETADDPAYTGTWATIATIANNGGGTAYEDYAYTPGQPRAIRHRISITVSGGAGPSVSTRLEGTTA
jgi:hypothetical protein